MNLMNPMVLVSALSIGLGLAVLAAYALRPRVSLLERRVESLVVTNAAPAQLGLWQRLVKSSGRRLSRILGGSADVAHRLERAGMAPNVEAFRTSQALWAMVALVATAGLVALSSIERPPSPSSAVGLIVFSVVSAVIAKDQLLTQQVKRREARMLSEFPTVADMLALAVAAGQGPLGALEHVTSLCRGPLASELARALDSARTGLPLTDSLAGVARRTNVNAIARFIDGTIVALERGTPLADVLRAQAQDARDAARGDLIEKAGKKEVLMMVPVVFLILPITILFATFPGLSALDLSL